MSCQQATRLLTTTATNTSATSKTREDPYVFSETVSATPPILFNVQKSRVKIPESFNISSTFTKSTHKKLPLTQLNVFTAKTSATLANVVSVTPASTNFKNEQNRKPASANVSISRTKQPQQQKQHLQQTSLPTPSLWQTPLLLESIVSPPTSPASLPSPPAPTPTPAPSVVSPNTSATLPPSNFHHTTFAQHLQKVGCIRKSPPAHSHKERSNSNVIQSNHVSKQATAAGDHVVSTTTTSVAGTATATVPISQNSTSSSEPLTHHKHSENDINEIPVNVIYRNPQANVDVASNLLSAKPQKDSQRTATAATNQPTIATSQYPQAAANLQPDTAGCQNMSEPKTTKSSIAVAPPTFVTFTPPTLNAIYKSPPLTTSAVATATTTTTKAEKCLQTDVFTVSSKPIQRRKVGPPPLSRKASLSQGAKKCVRSLSRDAKPTAFAVVTCSAGSRDGFGSSVEAQQTPAYIRQQHWLGVYELKMTAVGGFNSLADRTPSEAREERIEQHKSILRRQAMQLLAARTLLQPPLRAARRRLICVDRLLRKHEDHREVDFSTASCVLSHCNNQAMPMATHCYEHIGYNADQQLFLTCTAKFADHSQCRVPVFDIVHDLPLCKEHARKRDDYNRIWHEQHPPRKVATATANVASSTVPNSEDEYKRHLQQQQRLKTQTTFIYNKSAGATKPPPQRNNKRKQSSSAATVIKPVGRPQKRTKKATITANRTNASNPAPPPLSAVKHRKSSNTSLESIASNSHSSHSQPPFLHTSTANVVLAPPALAPLSGSNAPRYLHHHHPQQPQQLQHYDYTGRLGGGGGSLRSASVVSGDGFNTMLSFGNSSDAATHEINQIVAQFAMVANDNNNSNSHTDFSSGLSLPSADEILTQDMLSICENSSAYASSEDTGVGGLSETELMAGSGAHDVEDIPLGDTRLLEEHDLANVLNTLPVDAFNELFTAVRQDECDEVERALEIADKHLKSLQQTIGSDSDFLGDFLNVNDHLLDDNDICSKMGIVSSVLHSPDTSGLDTASLFGIEGGAGTTPVGGSCSNAVTDIRGLVQT